LKNTDYLIGMTTYTGHNTKIMKNSVKAKPKRSKMENLMNKFIIQIFIVQIVICFITAIVAASL